MRIVLSLCVAAVMVSNAAAQSPSEHFAPLAPYVGKTWKGTFQNYPAERAPTDVSKWEWALNGQAIMVTHSVDDGEYGGITIIIWDEASQSLVSHYFTTGGFMTRATITSNAGRIVSREEVSGHPSITVVESESAILDDGRLHATSRYLRDGEWVDGHEIIYVEAPDAIVRFKND